MDERTKRDEDLPHRDPADIEEIERAAERSRKQQEAVPAPGTDPLHEGP